MSNWIVNNNDNNQLLNDNFNNDINNLESNTLYEYRSYIIINGNKYYGDIKNIITKPIVKYIPIMNTGESYKITSNSMMICNNYVIDNGNSNIYEYGVLFTQKINYSDPLKLTVDNHPYNVKKTSICTSINVNDDYFIGNSNLLSNLNENTMTYYRSFSINECGVGYGSVKSSITLNNNTIPISLNIQRISSTYPNNSNGILNINPNISVNDNMNLNFNICHVVYNGGNGNTKIWCKNDINNYELIYDCTSNNSISEKVNINIKYNDSICWSHVSNGGCNSYNSITLTSIDNYSGNIFPIIGSNNCDKVISVIGME